MTSVLENRPNELFQYIPAPSVPPSDSLDAASPQAAAEQGRYALRQKEYLDVYS